VNYPGLRPITRSAVQRVSHRYDTGRVDSQLPTEVEEALSALLSPGERTGNAVTDLVAAAQRSLERRRTNSIHGGAVIAALRTHGLSWRQIEERTGIPKDTAQRWSTPPPTV
jgi:hypothetical protein